jgi:hypothetical protein
MRYLESAIANHDPLVGYIGVDPVFAQLHSHARWMQLLAAMNLAIIIND